MNPFLMRLFVKAINCFKNEIFAVGNDVFVDFSRFAKFLKVY